MVTRLDRSAGQKGVPRAQDLPGFKVLPKRRRSPRSRSTASRASPAIDQKPPLSTVTSSMEMDRAWALAQFPSDAISKILRHHRAEVDPVIGDKFRNRLAWRPKHQLVQLDHRRPRRIGIRLMPKRRIGIVVLAAINGARIGPLVSNYSTTAGPMRPTLCRRQRRHWRGEGQRIPFGCYKCRQGSATVRDRRTWCHASGLPLAARKIFNDEKSTTFPGVGEASPCLPQHVNQLVILGRRGRVLFD